MSEPTRRADRIDSLMSGIRHWSVHDDRLDFRSDAYAVADARGWVLIDPLPLEEEALLNLGPVQAICITGAFHQRAAWTLRERLGVPVHAPLGGQGLVQSADRSYDDGERLPGSLVAHHRPGPTDPHHVFLHEGVSGCTLFIADYHALGL